MITTELITIKRCGSNDAKVLTELGRQTFCETFEAVNTKADMDLYLNDTFTVDKIQAELEDESNQFFLAYRAEEPVGYAKISASSPPQGLNEKKSMEISRLYVADRAIGTGVGKKLMQHCLDTIKKAGCDVLWLGVWEHNQRAISFYKKWGFEKFGQHIFMLGSDAQTDHWMKKKI